jgi:hypothetical protein
LFALICDPQTGQIVPGEMPREVWFEIETMVSWGGSNSTAGRASRERDCRTNSQVRAERRDEAYKHLQH